MQVISIINSIEHFSNLEKSGSVMIYHFEWSTRLAAKTATFAAGSDSLKLKGRIGGTC